MVNLVVFNIYWYLILSFVVTFWALADILRKKEKIFFFKAFDYVVLVFGAVAWYASIFTFQSYYQGTLSPNVLEDMDTWTNVLLTAGYLVVSFIIYRRNKKLCE